ncbi:3'(2'),5'-bisphosphate nucleotidase CysQ [Natronospirillum operosum]|uniref:3'(2'),5'-bisphosphate nucleotidase CysQ n=1 Tax=Natronospirillum operosum TaxID=2759953 RepID=A0A4Z0WE02_9GAMM|nr:3'(2'),5'-bisphosphate nucleotidase CysQ [Natronospirillum operosum]TGG95240.1 3'(2'),5'-bisphosphate nucleotidase CysQ [Natronospirillum operosum]
MTELPVSALLNIAHQAGDAIMAVYARDFDTETKADNSPLTEADLAAHRVIVEQLQALTPDIPILSEESSDIPWAERQQWQRYWLVDPLDGTKEFIKKNGEFTVNIALIEQGEPVWGVVHAPALEVTYHGGTAVGQAFVGRGPWPRTASSDAPNKSEKPIWVAAPPAGKSGWRIVGSRSHQSDEFKAFVEQYEAPEIKSMGSSLKICLVADGSADLYPRLGLTSEWDTAAAHAVLLGAGGRLVEADSGQPLRYNQKESVLNLWFIASA